MIRKAEGKEVKEETELFLAAWKLEPEIREEREIEWAVIRSLLVAGLKNYSNNSTRAEKGARGRVNNHRRESAGYNLLGLL